MSKKKASAKGKKSRAQKHASTPPPSAASTSVSASSPASQAPASASKVLREPREKLDQKIDKLHEKIQEKSEAARAGFASDPAIDDTSIPPVVEDEFFAKGEEPHRVSHAGASGAFEPIHSDTRGSHRKLTPEAHARRGELAKYVKAVVAISAAILVLGLVRMSFFKGHKEEPVLANLGSAVQTAAAPSTAQPAQTQPAQTAVPTDQIPPAPLATAEEKVEPAALVEAGKVEEIKDDKPEVKPTRTAAQEKAAAQAALEGGNAGGAIGAGQRSVALDPTDAEAWLILGGAYQMQNRNGEAKAAFSSCVKQAKRGPVGECTQMLQQ